MSRLPRPCLPSSTSRLSRALRWNALRSVWYGPSPNRARAATASPVPEIVSCQPHVSATIEHNTRPMSEYSTRPAVRNAVNCAFSVSAML